ncbi:MAG TPA: hypothetical protein VFE47_18000 [Tepidisphaeraceae bacterium]|jgi:hypothetical protein|nr:hypothetical protein [Tepidisphaeraceae bacterium]
MRRFIPRFLFIPALILLSASLSQAQVDLPDAAKAGVNLAEIKVRVRVVKCEPSAKEIVVNWRHGGEGLGGTVTHGIFHDEKGQSTLAVQAWSEWLALEDVAGKGGGWKFPTLVVALPDDGTRKGKKNTPAVTATAIEFAFSRKGETFKDFVEDAPKGATAGFAVPAGGKINGGI